MAIITALRFTSKSGALCIDRESWHLLRRKTFFSDKLYLLVPEALANQFEIEIAYGGVGHPAFHYEVAERAEKMIERYLQNGGKAEVEILGRLVLQAFSDVHRRRINDRLEFIYGFSSDDINTREFSTEEKRYPIKQDVVMKRALGIVRGSEAPGYAPLVPPNEACIIGVDKTYGFSAFALKESDGVLSFQSCGFEAFGQGRDAAAVHFSKHLNRRFLEQRRIGPGKEDGWLLLLESTLEACDHFGQVGGGVRILELDAEGKDRSERVHVLSDFRAKLAIEIVRAIKEQLLDRAVGQRLIYELIDHHANVSAIERELFLHCVDVNKLEKVLRGYKIDTQPLPKGEHVLSWVEQTAREEVRGEQ